MNPPAPMRDARHLLILLGFVCQGYSFDRWYMPVLYGLLWVGCVLLQRPRSLLSPAAEDAITLVAITGAFLLGGEYGYNRLVFIGNGLIVFQAMRLLRPLNPRERMYSIAVALIHLGVGSQVVVDYEFILVLLGSLYLIPRALFNLEADAYHRVAGGRPPAITWRELIALAILMVVFFLAFPRIPISSPVVTPHGLIGARPPEEIDMTQPGQEPGEVLLFRIEGPGIDYIKGNSLDLWDGTTWRQSPWAGQARRSLGGEPPPEARHRIVKLLNARLLGNQVPTDGYVVRVTGPFVQRPYVAEHGGTMISFDHRDNLTYEYWSLPASPSAYLSARDRQRLVELPPPTPALTAWLERIVGRESDPDTIARTLVTHFQTNHQYELGAPQLDRLNPIDDFVLNQRSGHCERFASALAVLLRMKGIPARVALGWVATERNGLGDFYQVRARHGHAWTEAFIEGRGWVTYDGTPYGQEIVMERRPLGLTVKEWVEYVWYAKIVEFGSAEQLGVAEAVNTGLRWVIATLLEYLAPVMFGVLLVAALCVVVRRGWWRQWRLRWSLRRPLAVREARHFYGRMLKLLARQRLRRQPGQTPLEFLAEVQASRYPLAGEVERVTRWFCDVRYGNRDLTPEVKAAIQQALARIARGR